MDLEQKEGLGGYAGIHVPWIDENGNNNRDEGEYAILNLYGDGTLIAYGGNAGDGGGAVSGNTGGGRWRTELVLVLVVTVEMVAMVTVNIPRIVLFRFVTVSMLRVLVEKMERTAEM